MRDVKSRECFRPQAKLLADIEAPADSLEAACRGEWSQAPLVICDPCPVVNRKVDAARIAKCGDEFVVMGDALLLEIEEDPLP